MLQIGILLIAIGDFLRKKIVTSHLVVTALSVLIQFGGKHLKDMFGMVFVSISDII